MKITDRKFLKLQEGGEISGGAPAPEAAPAPEQAPEQGGDPLMQIVQAAALAVLTLDALLALLVCLALVELASQGQEAPAEAPGAPVYRKGGRLVRWENK